MKINRLNDKQFADAAKFYSSDKANAIATDFYQFAMESCLRYVEHGEVSHINTLALAAKRMRAVMVVRKLITTVACHKLGTTGKYTGKANTKRLNNMRKDLDKITRKLEAITKDAADAKVRKTEAKPFDTTAQRKTVTSTVNKLIKAELTNEQIIALVRAQLEEARPSVESNVVAVAA